MVNGYDFAHVIEAYWRASRDNNQDLKANAIRWLRGEYTTKTDARNALGVRTFVDDASFYDQLKLMSLFVRLAGYTGLIVCLRRIGQPLQALQPPGPGIELRTDPPNAQ